MRHLYCFSNRRRAKDTVLLMVDKYGDEHMMVFVREEMVYVQFNGNIPESDIDLLMHYAKKCEDNADKLLDLDAITELYIGAGILKFRV